MATNDLDINDSDVIAEAERVLFAAQDFYPVAGLSRRGTDYSRIVNLFMDDLFSVKEEIKDFLGVAFVRTSDISYCRKIPLFRARMQFPLPPGTDTEDFHQLEQRLEKQQYLLGAFGKASVELYDGYRAEPIYELTLRICLW